ncbi:MAG: hypothetical protein IPK58_11800 [Acidobacteria bacterium]|nr:hypothetical protein [Acidobacteriota bacterium]
MSDYGGQLVFASNLDGWIVGATGIVWLTENGGDTWSRVYPNDELNSELRDRGSMGYVPIDADNGWMGMDGGYILRTRNKGKTWEVTSVGDDCSILSLFPFSNDDAIAFCFERSRILRWNSVENLDGWAAKSRDSERRDLFSIFSSKHVGWAVGIEFNSDTRQKAKVVLRTVDGAETWQRQQVEVFGEQWKKVRFLNENDGWLVSQSTVLEQPTPAETGRLSSRQTRCTKTVAIQKVKCARTGAEGELEVPRARRTDDARRTGTGDDRQHDDRETDVHPSGPVVGEPAADRQRRQPCKFERPRGRVRRSRTKRRGCGTVHNAQHRPARRRFRRFRNRSRRHRPRLPPGARKLFDRRPPGTGRLRQGSDQFGPDGRDLRSGRSRRQNIEPATLFHSALDFKCGGGAKPLGVR